MGVLVVEDRHTQAEALAKKPHETSPAITWDREASDDSRGGTRTRDPGIMSAVL